MAFTIREIPAKGKVVVLNIENTVLVVIDVQGKLATLMHEQEAMMKNIIAMAKGARTLALPILWMEQIPDKSGATAPELAEALKGLQPMAKTSFSCYRHEGFMDALDKLAGAGVELTSVETALFELLKTAEAPQFRDIARLIKYLHADY